MLSPVDQISFLAQMRNYNSDFLNVTEEILYSKIIFSLWYVLHVHNRLILLIEVKINLIC